METGSGRRGAHRRAAWILAATLGLACSWVKLTPEAESVRVIYATEAASCERIAATRATTAYKVLFVRRGSERVQDELDRIARNEAAKSGANAVARLGPVVDGVQEFGLYRCPAGSG